MNDNFTTDRDALIYSVLSFPFITSELAVAIVVCLVEWIIVSSGINPVKSRHWISALRAAASQPACLPAFAERMNNSAFPSQPSKMP
jgi:hypothetical protein